MAVPRGLAEKGTDQIRLQTLQTAKALRCACWSDCGSQLSLLSQRSDVTAAGTAAP